MPRLTIKLFGPPQISFDETPLELGQLKPIALLAYLAVTGQRHTRSALAALLWPEYAQAHTYLRNNLSLIRQALGDAASHYLQIDRKTIAWRANADVWLDVSAFTERLRAFRAHNHDAGSICATCLDHLLTATALYQDDFLNGFTLRDSPPFDEWSYFQSEQLRNGLALALSTLAQHYGMQREFESAIGYTRRWLAMDPLHEPAHRQLMQLYAESGQWAQATRQYEVCEQVLRAEIDASPESATIELYKAIRRRQLVTATSGNEPASTAGGARNNLSLPLTPLIGRAAERTAVRTLLNRPEVRLVSLTGTGGVGKTHLSLQIAADLLAEFSDGVYFCSLAPIREASLVLSALAQTLALRERQYQPLIETLKQALHHKEVLIVLDNFEQVITAAPLLTELLGACPRVKLIVTSRAVLHLRGEYEFVVSPLALPQTDEVDSAATVAGYSAIELFCQRAQSVQHDFGLDATTAPIVVQICRYLDGLPLAIELAAAQMRHLSLAMLCRRLIQRPIADRVETPLQLLNTKTRDAPPRHRSLWAAIAWSYELLDPQEQLLFRRLAVFTGGWTVATAAAICGEGLSLDVWDGLTSLQEKHLVQRLAGGDQTPRFTMLETLREFGQDLLRQQHEWSAQTAAMTHYYVQLTEQAAPELQGPQSMTFAATLRAEYPNIRAVLQRGLAERDVETCLRLCSALIGYWLNSLEEGEESALATLALAEGSPPSAAYVETLVCAGVFVQLRGKPRDAYPLLQRSLVMDDAIGNVSAPRLMTFARDMLAVIMIYRGDYTYVSAYEAAEIAAARRAGDEWTLATVLSGAGAIARRLGDYERATALIEEALVLHRQIGDMHRIAWTLREQGALFVVTGEFARAQEALAASQRLCEENQLWYILGAVKQYWGALAIQRGNYPQAAAYLKEALILEREQGNPAVLIEVMEYIAELSDRLAKPAYALRLIRALASQRKQFELPALPIAQSNLDRMTRNARAQLDQAAAAVAWDEGAAMSLDDAIAYALAIEPL